MLIRNGNGRWCLNCCCCWMAGPKWEYNGNKIHFSSAEVVDAPSPPRNTLPLLFCALLRVLCCWSRELSLATSQYFTKSPHLGIDTFYYKSPNFNFQSRLKWIIYFGEYFLATSLKDRHGKQRGWWSKNVCVCRHWSMSGSGWVQSGSLNV